MTPPPPRIDAAARWRCLLCAADGIGGVRAWGRHYDDNHDTKGNHVQAHNYGDREHHQRP